MQKQKGIQETLLFTITILSFALISSLAGHCTDYRHCIDTSKQACAGPESSTSFSLAKPESNCSDGPSPWPRLSQEGNHGPCRWPRHGHSCGISATCGPRANHDYARDSCSSSRARSSDRIDNDALLRRLADKAIAFRICCMIRKMLSHFLQLLCFADSAPY